MHLKYDIINLILLKGSFGYHADDGCGFENGNVITNFGPKWAVEDTVVGCGIDFAKSKLDVARRSVHQIESIRRDYLLRAA